MMLARFGWKVRIALLMVSMFHSRPLKTIFEREVCKIELPADFFYQAQKNSHSSFEVICRRSQ
jgi:hypothetical protein